MTVLDKIKSAHKKPPPIINHLEKKAEIAISYRKQDFSKILFILFTQESRASFDGPEEFSRAWVSKETGHRSQTMTTAMRAIVGFQLIGPFKVPS